MKSEIFKDAIKNRNTIRFFYGAAEVEIDPYYCGMEFDGKKVIFGKMHDTEVVRKFEYKKIANIKVIKESRFAPVIPILVSVN